MPGWKIAESFNIEKLSKVYLLLGSNLGDSKAYLEYARKSIAEEVGSMLAQSSVLQTPAWGKTDQPDFLNQVLIVDTHLVPEAVLSKLLDIERRAGRERIEKWGARTLDIDILFYDDMVIDEEHLKVPHPLLQEREFALRPLAEVAGEFVHPVLKKTINLLLLELFPILDV